MHIWKFICVCIHIYIYIYVQMYTSAAQGLMMLTRSFIRARAAGGWPVQLMLMMLTGRWHVSPAGEHHEH